MQADVRIKFEELAEARGEPTGAEAEGRGDAQFPVRLFATVHQAAAHSVELEHDVLHRAEQQFALLGQDEAARVAVEQRGLEFLLERADLPAHRRLAEIENLSGMGEGAGIRRCLKNPQLVPIHLALLAFAPALDHFIRSTSAGG